MQFVFVLPLWSAAKLLSDSFISKTQEKKRHFEAIYPQETIPARRQTIPEGNNILKTIPHVETIPQPEGTIPDVGEGREGDGVRTTAQDTIPGSKETIPEGTIPSVFTEDEHEGEEESEEDNPFLVSFWLSPRVLVEALLGLVLSVSMCASMVSLSQFYSITEPYLLPYRPQWKFFLIKLLVFTNTWQRLFISIVGALGGLPAVGGPTGIGLEQGIVSNIPAAAAAAAAASVLCPLLSPWLWLCPFGVLSLRKRPVPLPLLLLC